MIIYKYLFFILLLYIGCNQKSPNQLLYDSPKLWAEPINDYLEVGVKEYPDGFDRRIGALEVFGDKLWIGYGDTRVNMGSVVPIEFRRFDEPSNKNIISTPVSAEGQGAKQRTPTDTGEERIIPFNRIDDKLWQTGYDSNNDDELWTQSIPGLERLIQGNIFVLEGNNNDPVWRKLRTIPGGEHVHDLAYFEGSIYAVGSGADHRREWDSGQIFRYLWRSGDMGKTFNTFHRVMYHDLHMGDTRYRALITVGKTLYVFGYINPIAEKGPMEGRHVTLRNGQLEELKGTIGPVVVWKTWPLNQKLALAIGNVGPGISRTFKIDASSIQELSGWADRRIIYITPSEKNGYWLVLSGTGTADETFAIHRFHESSIDTLLPVLNLGERALSSIALWHRDLYIGTADGYILKADKKQ